MMDFSKSIGAAMDNFGIRKQQWDKTACEDKGQVWKSLINAGIIVALRKWRKHSKERSENRRARLQEEMQTEDILENNRDLQMGVIQAMVEIVVGDEGEKNYHTMFSEIVNGIVPRGENEDRGIELAIEERPHKKLKTRRSFTKIYKIM
jgi:hypothetical protein